jgi:hypothetical protein
MLAKCSLATSANCTSSQLEGLRVPPILSCGESDFILHFGHILLLDVKGAAARAFHAPQACFESAESGCFRQRSLFQPLFHDVPNP